MLRGLLLPLVIAVVAGTGGTEVQLWSSGSQNLDQFARPSEQQPVDNSGTLGRALPPPPPPPQQRGSGGSSGGGATSSDTQGHSVGLVGHMLLSVAAVLVGLCCAWNGPAAWRTIFTVALAGLAAGGAYAEAVAWKMAPNWASAAMLVLQVGCAVALAVHIGFEAFQVLFGTAAGLAAAYSCGGWARSLDASWCPGFALLWYEAGGIAGFLASTIFRKPVLATAAPLLGGLCVAAGAGVLISVAVTPALFGGMRGTTAASYSSAAASGTVSVGTPYLPPPLAPWEASAEALLGWQRCSGTIRWTGGTPGTCLLAGGVAGRDLSFGTCDSNNSSSSSLFVASGAGPIRFAALPAVCVGIVAHGDVSGIDKLGLVPCGTGGNRSSSSMAFLRSGDGTLRWAGDLHKCLACLPSGMVGLRGCTFGDPALQFALPMSDTHLMLPWYCGCAVFATVLFSCTRKRVLAVSCLVAGTLLSALGACTDLPCRALTLTLWFNYSQCPGWLRATNDWQWPLCGSVLWSSVAAIGAWRQLGKLDDWAADCFWHNAMLGASQADFVRLRGFFGRLAGDAVEPAITNAAADATSTAASEATAPLLDESGGVSEHDDDGLRRVQQVGEATRYTALPVVAEPRGGSRSAPSSGSQAGSHVFALSRDFAPFSGEGRRLNPDPDV